MLSVFLARAQGLARMAVELPLSLPPEVVWIDLLEPTPEEERAVEAALNIDVPTREEMKEIETSNRLYEDNGALYMTATVAAKVDTDQPVSTAVTFILVGGRLVTNRYVDTRPFQHFISYAERHPAACHSAVAVLLGLMEGYTERIADVLERVGTDLDGISASIFARSGKGTPNSRDLRSLIERIGF